MSEIPASNEMMIAELYGWKWDNNYDTSEEVLPAIEAVLSENEDLQQFCERMRDYYYDTDDGYGPMSWRDFRGFTIQNQFDREFDRDRLFYEIEGRIRSSIREADE